MIQYRAERVFPGDNAFDSWDVIVERGHPSGASGNCPACGEFCRIQIPLELAHSPVDVSARQFQQKKVTRVIYCNSGVKAQRPEGVDAGCGRWWLAELVPVAEGRYRMMAAETDRLLGAARELHVRSIEAYKTVNKATEGWLAGIAAIVGVLGFSGAAIGRDNLHSLEPKGVVLVAGLVCLSFVLALFAVFLGYRAAFGWPTLESLRSDTELVQWFDKARSQTTGKVKLVRQSVRLAILAWLAVVAAVLSIWFFPERPKGTPVKVEWSDGRVVCGVVDLSRQSPFVVIYGLGKPVAAGLARDVAGVTPVLKCN